MTSEDGFDVWGLMRDCLQLRYSWNVGKLYRDKAMGSFVLCFGR